MRRRSDVSLSDTGRRFRVLLTGDNDSASAPNRTLTNALRRVGLDAEFRPDLPLVSGAQWLAELRNADAVIHLEYADRDPYSARQLAIATALGRPVVRWWVGTDVLGCLQDPLLARKAGLIARVVTASFACAEHLVDELAGIGIETRFIPSPLDANLLPKEAILPEVPRSVLVYLPAHRLEFYGAGVVREIAEWNPDLKFVIVGDESHHLRDLPNVLSLGWISDMSRLYQQIGCVLRITAHDGLPRIVIDALQRGRYVIYSWPLEGCWLAKTAREAHEKLRLFRQTEGPNRAGAEVIARLYDPPPEVRYEQLLKMESRIHLSRRGAALAIAAALTIRARLRNVRRGRSGS